MRIKAMVEDRIVTCKIAGPCASKECPARTDSSSSDEEFPPLPSKKEILRLWKSEGSQSSVDDAQVDGTESKSVQTDPTPERARRSIVPLGNLRFSLQARFLKRD